ncbi:MAG: EAL domain-containing protein [Gemmatimonadaceae bacterium]|nr:EAL domain-containing protein [Acetobacteraceae bacterium]
MPAAVLPEDEAERMAVLRSFAILDTPPDARFDALVRIAARIFDAPMSAVSLTDGDRQWFKSSIGLDSLEVPRDQAFCPHAILAPREVLVVEDAAHDPRFADSILVTGPPNIRFYAGAPIVGPAGQPLGTLCIFDLRPRTFDRAARDRLADLAAGVAALLDLHRSSVRLQHAAAHDPLTDLAPRALFDRRLAAYLKDGEHCAVVCLGIGRLAPANDQFGHDEGDAARHGVAARLRQVIRSGDTPTRLGGDEFAVLMPGPLAPDAPLALAGRVMAALAAPHLGSASAPGATSIGYAIAPAHGQDALSLMRAATAALRRARAVGPGAIVGSGDGAALPSASTIVLQDELRQALDDDAFTLHWQPYFDLNSGATVGQEALIRWNRPGHGPMSPADFIPVAERSGLVDRLDPWVLETACRAAAAWPLPQTVSVNMSPSWFGSGKLVRLTEAVLDRTGLPASRLVLEVTERMVIECPDVAREQLGGLARLGVRVALDDFGTGYSALATLKRFAFDKLKLDRKFVTDIGTEGRADALSRSIIQLAHGLGMTVCAEGVETEVQLDFLRRHQCDLVQGYLLGRPSAQPQFWWLDAPVPMVA